MKRIFVRAGIVLVGTIAWLLPNWANASIPSPLAVIDRGVTEQKSSVVPIEIYEIPYLADKHTLSTTGNPLLAIIGSLDVVHVIHLAKTESR